MEIRQLRYFVGVVDAGSLLGASRRLHVAQPALGQQITALERELGCTLFERTRKGMVLNDSGRLFLDHAKVVLADIVRAKDAVRASSGVLQGDVVIGLPTTIALAATVPIVAACRTLLPQVRLRVVEAYSGFLREWLQLGRLDVAILFGEQPSASVAARPLFDERLALIARRDGRRWPARIPLERAVRETLILPSREHGLRRIIDEACESRGLRAEVVAEIDSLTSVKRAVEAGIGCTILPMPSVAEELASGTVRASVIIDEAMIRRVVLATGVSRPSTAAVSAVAALMVDTLRERVVNGTWAGTWVG